MASDVNTLQTQSKKEGTSSLSPLDRVPGGSSSLSSLNRVPWGTSSLSPLNRVQPGGRQTFRSVGLYLAANAGFRKCILRNRKEDVVAPITLEALLEIPEELVSKHRDAIQPKMSCEMKDALTSLNKTHLMKKEEEEEEEEDMKREEETRDTRSTRRPKSLGRPKRECTLIRKKMETSGSSSKLNITDIDKGNDRTITDAFVLPQIPGISQATQQLLLRNKKLEKEMEMLKLQKETGIYRARMFLSTRSISADQEVLHPLSSLKTSGQRIQNKALPNSRKLSHNLPHSRKLSHNLPRSRSASAEDRSLSTLVSLKPSGNRRMQYKSRSNDHSLDLGKWHAE